MLDGCVAAAAAACAGGLRVTHFVKTLPFWTSSWTSRIFFRKTVQKPNKKFFSTCPGPSVEHHCGGPMAAKDDRSAAARTAFDRDSRLRYFEPMLPYVLNPASLLNFCSHDAPARYVSASSPSKCNGCLVCCFPPAPRRLCSAASRMATSGRRQRPFVFTRRFFCCGPREHTGHTRQRFPRNPNAKARQLQPFAHYLSPF
jgi:hypothetical protein